MESHEGRPPDPPSCDEISVHATIARMDPTRPPPAREVQVAEDLTEPNRDGRGLELLISAADGVRVIPIASGSAPVIGRTTDADIVVADPSISRRHARIHLGRQVKLEDLGSLNGTTVNGTAVRPGSTVPLEYGVAFQLASATFLVQRSQKKNSTPAAKKKNVLDLIDTPDQQDSDESTPAGTIVIAPVMRRIYAVLDVVAPTGLSVLVLGETGVGKEGLAEAVHLKSKRAGKKFLKLNCAALPESLLEAELFGYEKGAFTGAAVAKPGLFEVADGGTVFLDEIGEVPLSTQAKLLRVLECGEVLRMGSVVPKKIDVRYVAATNRDLKSLIGVGQFRADLFFRLNGVSLNIPPLRERAEEVQPLARHFAKIAAGRLGSTSTPEFDESAVECLTDYSWPGNVRELRNVVDRAVALCATGPIREAHLLLDSATPAAASSGSHHDETNRVDVRDALRRGPSKPPATEGRGLRPSSSPPDQRDSVAPTEGVAQPSFSPSLPVPAPPDTAVSLSTVSDVPRADFKSEMRALERQRIVEALERHGGNQSRAAKELSISRHTLMQRMELYGLARPRKRTP